MLSNFTDIIEYRLWTRAYVSASNYVRISGERRESKFRARPHTPRPVDADVYRPYCTGHAEKAENLIITKYITIYTTKTPYAVPHTESLLSARGPHVRSGSRTIRIARAPDRYEWRAAHVRSVLLSYQLKTFTFFFPPSWRFIVSTGFVPRVQRPD